MTNITASELKLLYIEILLIAIIGEYLSLYSSSPIEQSYSGSGEATNGITSAPSQVPWSTTLVDQSLGLPVGYTAIIIVSSIFLIPMTIMNGLVIARLAKDFVTQWI